jgi:hypothetical protein
VVGELDAVDGVDVEAEELEGEDGAFVADVAVVGGLGEEGRVGGRRGGALSVVWRKIDHEKKKGNNTIPTMASISRNRKESSAGQGVGEGSGGKEMP